MAGGVRYVLLDLDGVQHEPRLEAKKDGWRTHFEALMAGEVAEPRCGISLTEAQNSCMGSITHRLGPAAIKVPRRARLQRRMELE